MFKRKSQGHLLVTLGLETVHWALLAPWLQAAGWGPRLLRALGTAVKQIQIFTVVSVALPFLDHELGRGSSSDRLLPI